MEKREKVEIVLRNMISMLDDSDAYIDMFSEMLESALDVLSEEDAFGTEGQCDPRGDMRNQRWSLLFGEIQE